VCVSVCVCVFLCVRACVSVFFMPRQHAGVQGAVCSSLNQAWMRVLKNALGVLRHVTHVVSMYFWVTACT